MTETDFMDFVDNCPINERTADGKLVGRCWTGLDRYPRGDTVMWTCTRHGDVTEAVKTYVENDGKLTPEDPL